MQLSKQSTIWDDSPAHQLTIRLGSLNKILLTFLRKKQAMYVSLACFFNSIGVCLEKFFPHTISLIMEVA